MKRVITLILSLVLAFLLCGCSTMSEEEEYAAQDVKTLVSMMKDPESFKLRGDIVLAQNYILDGTVTFIDFTANNSYGGAVRSLVFFYNHKYLGHSDDTIDDFSDMSDWGAFCSAHLALDDWNRLGE